MAYLSLPGYTLPTPLIAPTLGENWVIRHALRVMYVQYHGIEETPYGPMKCSKVAIRGDDGEKAFVAALGGIPLRKKAISVQDTIVATHSLA